MCCHVDGLASAQYLLHLRKCQVEARLAQRKRGLLLRRQGLCQGQVHRLAGLDDAHHAQRLVRLAGIEVQTFLFNLDLELLVRSAAPRLCAGRLQKRHAVVRALFSRNEDHGDTIGPSLPVLSILTVISAAWPETATANKHVGMKSVFIVAGSP